MIDVTAVGSDFAVIPVIELLETGSSLNAIRSDFSEFAESCLRVTFIGNLERVRLSKHPVSLVHIDDWSSCETLADKISLELDLIAFEGRVERRSFPLKRVFNFLSPFMSPRLVRLNGNPTLQTKQN